MPNWPKLMPDHKNEKNREQASKIHLEKNGQGFSKEKHDDKLHQARMNFIDGAGRISASLLGILNRVCGQIYALLLLSSEPLSLDDIVTELGVSKGNVSVNIRVLEDYKLVKKVWVKGTRKDYYEANATLPTKVIKEFFDKIRRNIHDSLDMLEDCCHLAEEGKAKVSGDDVAKADLMLDRLQLIRSFYQGAHALFDALYTGEKIDGKILKPLLED